MGSLQDTLVALVRENDPVYILTDMATAFRLEGERLDKHGTIRDAAKARKLQMISRKLQAIANTL